MASIRDGVRAAAPLAPGPILFGLTFGVLATDAGFSPLQATVFSALTFAGASQFAAVSVLLGGGTVASAIGSGVLLNLRYVPMSVAIASLFPGGRVRRLFESQLTVDESWALSGRSGTFERGILIGAGLLLYPCWVGATVLGTVIGDQMGETVAFALGAGFATLFLGLAIPYLNDSRSRLAAAIGVLIVIVLLPIAPAGVPIAAASLACLLGLRR